MPRWGVVIAVLLTLAGCAGSRLSRDAGDPAGMAAPGPDLVGTWRGMAFAVPGSNYGVSTPVELAINPDGTWSWSKNGVRQAAGRVHLRGDRVIFTEDTAREIEETIDLARRGEHLWGVSRAFLPGMITGVDLRRDPS